MNPTPHRSDVLLSSELRHISSHTQMFPQQRLLAQHRAWRRLVELCLPTPDLGAHPLGRTRSKRDHLREMPRPCRHFLAWRLPSKKAMLNPTGNIDLLDLLLKRWPLSRLFRGRQKYASGSNLQGLRSLVARQERVDLAACSCVTNY